METGPGSLASADELRRRRARLLECLPAEALVLVRGAVPGVAARRFRQSNEFYYLSGIEVPGAYLLLDARKEQASLYLPHRNVRRERSDGPTLSAEDHDRVIDLTGVESVAGPEQLPLDLASIFVGPHRPTFVPRAPAEGAATSRDSALSSAAWEASDPLCSIGSAETALIDGLARHFPRCDVHDLSPVLDELRLHKSPYELEQMRAAARICGDAIVEAMRSTAVGVYEYELEAVASFVFRKNGAAGAGYEAIVASGPNAWHGHYNTNDAPLRDGDLVLMDYAPDYHYYTSDIGRMWPVNGRYTSEQRELYGFVVAYRRELLSRIRPGATPSGVLEDASEAMRAAVEEMTFSKAFYRDACERALAFPGHLSHPVGMSVHDVGSYANRTFQPGLVFSVDPMIWVPEENLYIRVEDTVAVSSDGVENLTGFVPVEAHDVEAAMREPGLLDLWKAHR